MTTTLTKDIRDRAVDALRRAHAEGRKKTEGEAWNYYDPKAVCSCVIIAEGFEVKVVKGDDEALYQAIVDLGFPADGELPIVTEFNDKKVLDSDTTFDQVADMVAALDVVEEAEAILREAALVPA